MKVGKFAVVTAAATNVRDVSNSVGIGRFEFQRNKGEDN